MSEGGEGEGGERREDVERGEDETGQSKEERRRIKVHKEEGGEQDEWK